MRNEFLFKMPGHKEYMSFKDLIDQMTEILAKQVVNDFDNMDKVMVEVFDNRLAEQPTHGSLGKIALPVLIQKFR